MSWGTQDYSSSVESSEVSTEEDSLSSAQEAVPVPLLCGERKIAANWMTRVYNQYA